jgi:ADP-heptose:LPS heptosyltransferase
VGDLYLLIATIKNIFLYVCIFFLREKKRPCPPNRILIVTTTALGDTLWATPSIKALRASFPTAWISVWTSPLGKEVLDNNPDINAIYVAPKLRIRGFFAFRKTLAEQKFSKILIFHTSQRITLPICSTLGAAEIIGRNDRYKGFYRLLTHNIDPPPSKHEIMQRCDLLSHLSIKPSSYSTSYYPTKQELEQAKTLHNHYCTPGQSLILLHPGATDRFKCWPIDYYIELAHLLKKNPYRLVVSATKKEQDLSALLSSSIPTLAVLPQLTLRMFAAFIKTCALVITNDTGPMHLAHAMHVPTIALFSSTSSKICGPFPRSSTTHIIEEKATCSPCLKRFCQKPFCFLRISPQRVLKKVLEVLPEK